MSSAVAALFTSFVVAHFSPLQTMPCGGERENFGNNVSCHSSRCTGNCRIDVKTDFHETSPLVFKEGSSTFLYPSVRDNGNTVIPMCGHFDVACPRSSVTLNIMGVEKLLETDRVHVVCYCRRYFQIPGIKEPVLFKNISCLTEPHPTAKNMSDDVNATITTVQIGFNTSNFEFATTIQLCHDHGISGTLWTFTKIQPTINTRQHLRAKPKFRKSKFYKDIPISNVYTIKYQRDRLMKIFKEKKVVDQYFSEAGHRYFVRSHLAPHSDQFYKHQQGSTYFYVNTAPMWQRINNGNWKAVESYVRTLAARDKVELLVLTGNIGVLELADANKNPKKIYLYRKRKNVVPAPKLFFKCVYNRETNNGIVFITVNNPHLRTIPRSYRICNFYRPCHKTFHRFLNVTLGYTYCCTYRDFFNYTRIVHLDFPRLPNKVGNLI